MSEIVELILRLSEDLKLVKAYVQSLRKSKTELFKDTWIDGQEVMQALHISKRTLQSLRDGGVLPYSRINGKFYYKVQDIESLLESNYSGNSQERRSHGNH
jgi:hypothetical protein